jgi:hypothetical protein
MKETQEFQISISSNDGILEIIAVGKLTGRNVSAFQKEINAIRAGRGDRILLDVRLLTERNADTFYNVRRPENASGKTAVLDLPENKYVEPLLERVARYTPMQLKWFSDIDAAKAWLKSE